VKPIRAFLAIPITEPVREQIGKIQGRLRQTLPGVSWVRPETIHLTLQFFGAATEEELAEIGRIMLSIGRLFTPFEVLVQGIGAFPSAARPRVIWLGLENHSTLQELHCSLRRELNGIGLAEADRPFTPHLTLGRCRQRIGSAVRQMEPFQDVSCGLLPVGRMVLFESQLRPAGALHLPRLSVPLGSAAG